MVTDAVVYIPEDPPEVASCLAASAQCLCWLLSCDQLLIMTGGTPDLQKIDVVSLVISDQLKLKCLDPSVHGFFQDIQNISHLVQQGHI